MSDRQVILSARGNAAQIELIREGEGLYLARNGERLPAAQWPVAEVEQAADAFHRLMKSEGLR
jgi:hypothetical protein